MSKRSIRSTTVFTILGIVAMLILLFVIKPFESARPNPVTPHQRFNGTNTA